MPWTDPSTHIWAAAEKLTAANLNTYVEANLVYLYGDTAWTNASGFTNSWVSSGAGNVARFILIGRIVYLDGMVTGGTLGLAAFTLPSGYRPSQAQRFGNSANAVAGVLVIQTAGTVIPTTGATTNVGISCSFPVV